MPPPPPPLPSRASADSPKICTLWVHNASFSKDEVLFNAAALLQRGSALNGQLLKILPHHPDPSPARHHARAAAAHASPPDPDSAAFVFVAQDLSDEQRTKHPNLQISVSEAIAACHGFYSRMSVRLVAAEREHHAASHVELHFKDPLNRDDLWKMIVSELHRKQCLYEGQKIKYLGSIEFTVRRIYVRSQKAASAIFTDHSKPIFRSLAARYVLCVQLSEEIWAFDQHSTCEIRWIRLKTALLELFERWDALGAKHSVTLFFFTRLCFPRNAQSGLHAQDFYRVLASELPSADCKSLHDRLDEEFRSFLKDVETRRSPTSSEEKQHSIITGSPVPARAGNFLEAVNLAASASLHDDIDLDFVRTGTLVLVLTPGPAMFDVEESLLRMTSARLIARQIGVELVSTSLPPLHVAPLFVLGNASKDLAHDGVMSSSTAPKCVIPSWVETSFYEGPKKKPANATKYSLFAHEQEELGFQYGRQPSLSPGDALGLGISQLSFSRQHAVMSQRLPQDDKNDFLKRAQKADQDLFTAKDTQPHVHQSRQEARSSVKLPTNLDRSEAVSGLSSQLGQVSCTRLDAGPRAHHPSVKSLEMVAEPSHAASERRRPVPEYRLNPMRNGLLRAKATATTSSTTDTAQSSTASATAHAAPGQDDPSSITSQFRASLQHKAPSHSLHSLTSSLETKESESQVIPSPIAYDEASAAMEPRSVESTSAQTDTDDAANFFGAASSSFKRTQRLFGPRPSSGPRFSDTTSDDMPWFVVKSPLKPHKASHRTFGEWNHVSTRQVQAYVLKWKALCTPASLPLTTEDFPSWSQLQANFTESPYRVAIVEDHLQESPAPVRQAHLARELLQARISDGFQIAIGRKAREITGADDIDLYAADLMGQEGAAVLLVRGDDIQLLAVSAGEVAVTRFQRRKHPLQAIHYQACIRTALERSYQRCDLRFGISSERNWNNVDTQIARLELDPDDDAPSPDSGALTKRRARFVLIPVSPSSSLSAVGSGNEDSDEEIRIEGIRRLTMLWQKNRWHHPSRQRHKASWAGHKDLNPLAIEYHTRDPSAVVAAGLESINEGETAAAMTQLFYSSESFRTSNVDLQDLAAELQGERGIRIKTRRWHFRTYEYCFIGVDLVTFLMARFQDIRTRDEAVEFGNLLLKKCLFYHVHGKHAFRDGQYFYSISDEYRITRSEARSSGWFGTRRDKPFTPALSAVDRPRPLHSLGDESRQHTGRKSKVCLNASLQFNLDPRKNGTRTEVVTIHYDRLHNPENSFHFEIEWQNATTKLVEDALISWATTIAKYGLKLVQLPVAESARITEINPLRSPYLVDLAVRPPNEGSLNVADSPSVLPQSEGAALPFQKAILRRLDFVLDFEAETNFPANVAVTYTWGTSSYKYAQYIHRSGMLLAQIISDTRFILLANRFYNNRGARGRDHMYKEKTPEKGDRERRVHSGLSRSASALFSHGSPASSPAMRPVLESRHSPLFGPMNRKVITAEGLKDKFESFCHDASALRSLYDEVLQQASLPTEKPTPSLTAASAAQTPLLQASIPSLDIAEEEEGEESLTLPPRR